MALPVMEDISLPSRCKGSLGHGENASMAEVGPLGPNGNEIPVSLVYDQVALAAKYSQQDCRLDRRLDGIEE